MTNPDRDLTQQNPGGCPSLDRIVAYLDSSDSIADADQDLDRHIQECTLCQAAIEEMRGSKRGQWISSLISEQKQMTERKLPEIPGFRLIREISSGGQGIVYFAMEEELNRPVALKFLKHGKFSSELEIQQFFNEALAVAALEHPAIIRLYGMRIHDGIPYLIIQWAEDGSLADRLARSRPTTMQAVDLIRQVTRAIAFAHENGIIHRDLKPSNILMKSADYSDCRISDFGLARKFSDAGDEATCTRYLGTPGFMAPEMVSDDFGKPGPLSDLFSIGAIFYLLLTGRLAHAGNTPIEIHHLLLNRDPIPPRYFNPQIPKDLQTICLKCLEKEPHRRYRSALELATDLELFQSGRPIRARRAGPVDTAMKWCRRNKTLAATILTFWLTTVAASGYILHLYQKSQTQLDETRDTITYLAPMAKRIFSELNVTQVERERLEQSLDLMMQTGIESRNVETQRNANFAVLELADIIGHWDNSARPMELARFSIRNSRDLLAKRARELKRIPDLYDRTEIDYAQALLWLADYLQYDHVALEESEKLLREALIAARNVVSRRVSPVESLGVLGRIHNDLANCLAARNKLDEAELHFREGEICQAEVLNRNPENRVRYALLARIAAQHGLFQWRFHDNPQVYLEFWDSRYSLIDSFLKDQERENWSLIAPELIVGYPDRSYLLHERLHQMEQAEKALDRKIEYTERIVQRLQSPNPHLEKSLAISRMDRLLLEARRSPEKRMDRQKIVSLLIPTLKLYETDLPCSPLIIGMILAPRATMPDYSQAVELLARDESARKIAESQENPRDQLIEILKDHRAKTPRHYFNHVQYTWAPERVMEHRLMIDLLQIERLIDSNQPDQARAQYNEIMAGLDHQLTTNLLAILRLEEIGRALEQ